LEQLKNSEENVKGADNREKQNENRKETAQINHRV
jgi:hypothetical protein